MDSSEASSTSKSTDWSRRRRESDEEYKDISYYDLTPPGETISDPEPEPITSGNVLSDTETDITTDGDVELKDPSIEPRVAVIGVGYVGEHLVDVFSRRFNVIGFDVSESRVKALSPKYAQNDRVQLTSSSSRLSGASHFLISVPTLLRPDNTVDTSYLRSALDTVEKYASAGCTVVFESSVAVGMTRKLLGPVAKRMGLFAGMSPERVDPGRVEPAAYEIPKVISGLEDVVPGSLAAISELYSAVYDKVVTVSQPEVAEMTKLYENCQRMMCIAFANEMANACTPFGIDPYEVYRAAATKPFGYMSYSPGLGVGGHCIPVNPYYLLSTSEFPLLKAATEKMNARPAEIGQNAIKLLSEGPIKGVLPHVLVVGMGFKRGQSHLVNSPGLELAKSLVLSEKVAVSFADPLVGQEAVPQIPRLDEKNWSAEYLEQNFDMIIVAFKPEGLDFGLVDKLTGVRVQMWCV
ncbi:UDP-glucose/GDP-mannose dehydrogenase family, central domain-containing protein [Trichoderma breve]|uniref:UDP-glucose/GDP-mannose dehydrogenase family, central domain-containing protein n=1 Tax=Trichoderma breve TaxID=2034170 RepID=A0A9W9BCB1_9HYPO|nr:UDP-glucose/GDP-mannose dehydrogenase family, central domain-containing protein [Trichoderma breve]KAJ4860618.1 UDP-glucose/GDP-mannose dehydrogenase family, central domain-containing protein [Trichoderma breve]